MMGYSLGLLEANNPAPSPKRNVKLLVLDTSIEEMRNDLLGGKKMVLQRVAQADRTSATFVSLSAIAWQSLIASQKGSADVWAAMGTSRTRLKVKTTRESIASPFGLPNFLGLELFFNIFVCCSFYSRVM